MKRILTGNNTFLSNYNFLKKKITLCKINSNLKLRYYYQRYNISYEFVLDKKEKTIYIYGFNQSETDFNKGTIKFRFPNFFTFSRFSMKVLKYLESQDRK